MAWCAMCSRLTGGTLHPLCLQVATLRSAVKLEQEQQFLIAKKLQVRGSAFVTWCCSCMRLHYVFVGQLGLWAGRMWVLHICRHLGIRAAHTRWMLRQPSIDPNLPATTAPRLTTHFLLGTTAAGADGQQEHQAEAGGGCRPGGRLCGRVRLHPD